MKTDVVVSGINSGMLFGNVISTHRQLAKTGGLAETTFFVQSSREGFQAGASNVYPYDIDRGLNLMLEECAMSTALEAMDILAGGVEMKNERQMPYIVPEKG